MAGGAIAAFMILMKPNLSWPKRGKKKQSAHAKKPHQSAITTSQKNADDKWRQYWDSRNK